MAEMQDLDGDGYPTDGLLARVAAWTEDFAGLMELVRANWQYDNYFRSTGPIYLLSTGGWSGNESLIQALQQNRAFWMLCWVSSRRGGHYEFEVPASPDTGKERAA